MRSATPDLETHPSKRQRIGFSDFTPVTSDASPHLSSARGPASPTTPWVDSLITGHLDHSLLREWQVDPYTSNPGLTTELVYVFFKNHVPESASCMLPEGAFKSFALSSGEKSLDDLMLLYTVLAVSSLFSLRPEHKPLGVQYAAISRYACDSRHFTVQLVQSRLLLSMYYIATNHPNDAWDFCGGAMRAAEALELNLELEKTSDSYLRSFPFGLNRACFSEMRRRTFWNCYLINCYNGYGSGCQSRVNLDDVFLRLPADDRTFEAQVEAHNPYLDRTGPPIQHPSYTIGYMAYTIVVSEIWADVMTNIYRTVQRPTESRSNTTFAAFYDNTSHRLRAWQESLPDNYIFSPDTLQRAIDQGNLTMFVMMHAVYHTTAMKLNRYIQKSTLNPEQIAHHTAVARKHAVDLLAFTDALAARKGAHPVTATDGGSPRLEKSVAHPQSKVSTAFVGYAITSAIDILTSRVELTSVPTLLASFSGAQSIMGELALFWHSAKNQQRRILQRMQYLGDLVAARKEGGNGPSGSVSLSGGKQGWGREVGEGSFELRESIEKLYAREFDVAYA